MAQSVVTRQGSQRPIHLLLGNGFSIALKPDIFSYSSLFDKADFSSTPEVVEVFKAIESSDFELAVRTLEEAAVVIPCYLAETDTIKTKMLEHAKHIKNVLVGTIAGNHPSRPGEISEDQYKSCGSFLNNFLSAKGRIYSLNYDILLYWVLMHTELKCTDGFGNDEDDPDAEFVCWNDSHGGDNNVYYLHGALHLFDAGHQLRKYTWIRTAEPLIEQARRAISQNAFPLFVSEGSSAKKMAKIRHHGYLQSALKSFSRIQGSLFIHGLSLSPNDEHILKRIEKGKVEKVFVSIYGSPDSEPNSKIITRALAMEENRPYGALKVHFYDSSSANVWG